MKWIGKPPPHTHTHSHLSATIDKSACSAEPKKKQTDIHINKSFSLFWFKWKWCWRLSKDTQSQVECSASAGWSSDDREPFQRRINWFTIQSQAMQTIQDSIRLTCLLKAEGLKGDWRNTREQRWLNSSLKSGPGSPPSEVMGENVKLERGVCSAKGYQRLHNLAYYYCWYWICHCPSWVGLSAACLVHLGINQSAIPTLQKVIRVGTTWHKNADLESVIVLLGKGCLLLFHCFAKGDESLHIQPLLLIWNLSQPKGYLLLPHWFQSTNNCNSIQCNGCYLCCS